LTGDNKHNTDADVLIMTTEILCNKLSHYNTETKPHLDFDMNDLGCVIFDRSALYKRRRPRNHMGRIHDVIASGRSNGDVVGDDRQCALYFRVVGSHQGETCGSMWNHSTCRAFRLLSIFYRT